MTRNPWFALAILAGLVASAGDASADTITGITIAGPGGTGTATIDNTGTPTAIFLATFTSLAPIDFVVNVDDPGLYYLSFQVPPGSVVNATGVEIGALEFTLLGGPTGSSLFAGQSNSNGPLPNATFPGAGFRLSGPPNLAPGGTASIGAGFLVGGPTGAQTFTARLTPFAATPVPEPAGAAMATMGALGVAGYLGLRRRSRRSDVSPSRS